MTKQVSEQAFDTRAFVAAIRAGLDAAGRHDVEISRQWIDMDVPGERLLVNVPVGPELRVPLRIRDYDLDTADKQRLAREASDFVKALVNLKRAEKPLATYAKAVRRAALVAVEGARSEGLDIQLADVGFKPVRAWNLTGRDWKDAADHVLCAVTVRHTTFFLRPGTETFIVEEAEHVADEMRDLLEEQRERQAGLDELDRRGADLEVDAITLDILQACGLDAIETLRTAWRNQYVNINLADDGEPRWLSLGTSGGRVTASLTTSTGAAWNGEYMWFLDPARSEGVADLVGRTLGDHVSHPAFSNRPIVRVDGVHGHQLIRFDLSDKLLFDADTGRFWREERRLAA